MTRDVDHLKFIFSSSHIDQKKSHENVCLYSDHRHHQVEGKVLSFNSLMSSNISHHKLYLYASVV